MGKNYLIIFSTLNDFPLTAGGPAKTRPLVEAGRLMVVASSATRRQGGDMHYVLYIRY